MYKEHDRESSCRTRVEEWELKLAEKVASAFDTEEQEELTAELNRKLAELKSSPPSHIKDWKSYLAKFLYNKASNWARDSRLRSKKHLPLGPEDHSENADEEKLSLESLLPAVEENPDERVAFAEVWDEMDPQLRDLWMALEAEGGNQAKAAKRLRKHRNTVILWLKKLQELLKRHGF